MYLSRQVFRSVLQELIVSQRGKCTCTNRHINACVIFFYKFSINKVCPTHLGDLLQVIDMLLPTSSVSVIYLFLISGQFCETRSQLPCRDEFFSASDSGTCGPCNCDLRLEYNPVCNKTTGECYCKVSLELAYGKAN